MIKLHPEFLERNGKRQFVILSYEEYCKLKELIEDVDDLMELRSAKRREGQKQTTPLEKVRKDLRLTE